MERGPIQTKLMAALPWLLALLSGLTLASAFPPLEWSDLGWLGLIPLLLAIQNKPPKRALALGWVAGCAFWLTSISWLTIVTVGGFLLLSMYCALYFGLFASAAAFLFNRWGTKRVRTNLLLMAVLPLLWVGTEFVRSIFMTGFAWNALGVSQFDRLPVIQIASLGGVYMVSALMVLLNVALMLTVQRYIREGIRGRRAFHPEMMIGFLALALAISYGSRLVRNATPMERSTRLALIQPAIPQYEKWSEPFVDMIYDRLENLTAMALYVGQPDLVIWPETAVPGYIRSSPRSHELVYRLTREGAPILVGTMDVAWRDGKPPLYYNSSILFDRAGNMVADYDKQHLVMFGEYVPLQRYFPFLSAITPIEESFDAGERTTIFTVPDQDIPFAVLICFEDTVARLSRRAVRQGARLVVNQTNDAWFDVSSANRQHMTHSVFRAVENRVPVTRCANTGVSCSIDTFGRVYDVLDDGAGNTLTDGFKMTTLEVPADDMPLSIYTRFGDWFGWTGALAWASVLGWMYRNQRAQRVRNVEGDKTT